jgi:hypothetical protein
VAIRPSISRVPHGRPWRCCTAATTRASARYAARPTSSSAARASASHRAVAAAEEGAEPGARHRRLRGGGFEQRTELLVDPLRERLADVLVRCCDRACARRDVALQQRPDDRAEVDAEVLDPLAVRHRKVRHHADQ